MLRPQLFCLLAPGPVESGVTQTPKHLITARNQQVTLRCSYISGHLYVYWYQQAQGQGPQFLVQYFDKKEGAKGNLPDRFKVKQFDDSRAELTMSSLELADSALYLCASSQDTALQAQQPAVQKQPCAGSGSDRQGAAASQPAPPRTADCLPLGCAVLMLRETIGVSTILPVCVPEGK